MMISTGIYVPTSDALDLLLLPEDLWELEPERAIALVTVREMFFTRGVGFLGDDVKRIAGSDNICYKGLIFPFTGTDVQVRMFLTLSHSFKSFSPSLFKERPCGACHLERATPLSITLTTQNCTGDFSAHALDCLMSNVCATCGATFGLALQLISGSALDNCFIITLY